MNYLLVLCGPVACGKSTLIREFLLKHPDFVYIDVFNYIQKYKDGTGHIEPEGSLKAHQEMHSGLAKINQNVILEIGTNREELNFNGINSLKDKFKVKIVFCLLDKDICIKRVLDRAQKNNKRVINPFDLEAKFKRPFPDNHIAMASENNLSYIRLDMSILLEEKLEILNSLVKDKYLK